MSDSKDMKVGVARILALLGMGVAILALIGLAAAGSLWLLDRLGVKGTEVRLPVLLIVGLVGLLFAVAVLVAAFQSFGLAKPEHALGLPEGSVRAMIALMLILLFAIAGLYIYATIDEASSPDVGKQLVTTMSTLVVAVSAFYFGAKAVEAGVAAVQAPGAAVGAVTLSPSEADFGSVRVGEESSPNDFTVTNRTTTNIEVTDVTLKGDEGFEVVVAAPDQAKSWWQGQKVKVAPDEEISIRTRLVPPRGQGAVAATLMVLHTASGVSPTASLKGKVEPQSAGGGPAEEALETPVEEAPEEVEEDLDLEEEEEEELPPDESPDATTEAGLTEAGLEPDEDVEFEDEEGEERP